MKLYSGPLSLFTAKVRIALAEKGVAYERTEVEWSLQDRYLPHHPDVVALNPRGEVPVLVDGDTVVSDSTVILEYLEDRYPKPALYPKSPEGRVRCRSLEAAADEVFFPAVWSLIEEGFYPAPADGRQENRLAAARESIESQYQRLDREMGGNTTLCKQGFSVADIGWAVMVNAASTLGSPPADEFSQVQGWLASVKRRSAVAVELAETQAFVAGLFSSTPDETSN